MLISLDEAKEIITPDIAAALAYCSAFAFREWFKEVSDKGRASCSSCTKANFINDQMIHYAKTIFPESSDIKFIPKHGRYQLLIKGKLLFKMKKLNRDLRPSNIPTKTVLNYNAQLVPPAYNVQLRFSNMPDDITHLITGYKEDSLKTGMSAFVICPNGKYNHWVWPLDFTPLAIETTDTIVPSDNGQSDKPIKKVTPKMPERNDVPDRIGNDTN
jgi:hypothetical protein